MPRGLCARSATAISTIVLFTLSFAIGTTAQVRNRAEQGIPDIQLPSPARGPEALSLLAPYLPEIAAAHRKPVDELRSILLRDNTIWTDTRGHLFYGCEFGPAPQQAPGVQNSSEVLQAPYPDDQTFLLHSRPSATKVIYLDFDGETTSGTAWNGGATIVSAPFDLDGDPSSFSSSERERIQYIWQRVAEDYAPFDVDVTTQDPGVEGIHRSSYSDLYYGMRVVISPTNWYDTNAGGVAYIGVFNVTTDYNKPCWVFTEQLWNDEKNIAEAVSHEVGHTFGLHHDGLITRIDPLTNTKEYYSGQGNWAPIMGVGYYREVSQWSKGEYSDANNREDDIAIIQSFVPAIADDHGNTIGTATPLTGPSISASGIIETRADVDMFSFETGGGSISLSVNPAPRSPNLDVSVTLYDATGNLVTSNDGAGLPASITANVTTGTYYLAIDGVGSGDPVTSGYSDYDSLGQYQITGTVVPTGKQSPVATASASPTTGTAPLAVNFSSAGSSDPDGTIQSYYWDFNDGTNSSLANPSHTYNNAGTYTATLVVTDNDGLSSSATATATVTARVNQAPVANAAATPSTGYAPLAVSFSSAGSYDSDGSIQSFSWAFGDGVTSSSINPSYTYNSPGTFTAVLTVTDNLGAKGTKSVTISVQNPNNRPDLIVSSVSTSASSAAAGTTITVSDTTKNQGVAPAAASMTSIYLSLDAVLDAGDTLIGSRSVAALGIGSSSAGSTVVTIPANTVPGARYLIVRADGGQTVGESNETNNTRTKSITITGPDLQVSALSAPSSAIAGSTITVTDTTKNRGAGPAVASTTNYYLSIDSAYGTTDTLIGGRGIGALLNGAANTGSAAVTIPSGTAAGTYYIIARADGGLVVAETNETNNTKSYRIVVN